MKSNIRKVYELRDINLSFRPVSVTFHKPASAKYRMYLQKNVQVIGQVNEIVIQHLKDHNYVFSSSIRPISFRVVNERYSDYQISIYQLSDEGTENYIDHSEFNLKKFLEAYFAQFIKFQQQLYFDLKEKDKSTLADLWRVISNNFTRKAFSSAVAFKKINAVLDFICEPQNQYDLIVKKADLELQKKADQRRNRNSTLLVKSKTVPQLSFDHAFPLPRHYESDVIKPQITKEELIQIHNKMNKQILSNIQEVQESNISIKIIGGLETRSKIKQELTSNTNNTRLNLFESINEEKDQNVPTGNLPQAINEEQIQNFYQVHNAQGYTPTIQLQNYRDLVRVETKSTSAKIGNLSLESVVYIQKQSQAKSFQFSKSNLLVGGILFIYLFLIVFLMHPLPKV